MMLFVACGGKVSSIDDALPDGSSADQNGSLCLSDSGANSDLGRVASAFRDCSAGQGCVEVMLAADGRVTDIVAVPSDWSQVTSDNLRCMAREVVGTCMSALVGQDTRVCIVLI